MLAWRSLLDSGADVALLQYVAVSTGLGGGSPRNVPNLLAPDVRYPRTGNALYVFKLRDRQV